MLSVFIVGSSAVSSASFRSSYYICLNNEDDSSEILSEVCVGLHFECLLFVYDCSPNGMKFQENFPGGSRAVPCRQTNRRT